MVDAAAFPKLFETRDMIEDRPDLGVDEFDEGSAERSIVDLLTEQVECADILLINKVDTTLLMRCAPFPVGVGLQTDGPGQHPANVFADDSARHSQ